MRRVVGRIDTRAGTTQALNKQWLNPPPITLGLHYAAVIAMLIITPSFEIQLHFLS